MSHTPGPWNAIKVTTPQYGSVEHGWGVVADEPMRGRIDSAISGMRESDARLIAAAPDLLQACKQAKKYLESDLIEPGRTAFWALVDAIAKAEGKT